MKSEQRAVEPPPNPPKTPPPARARPLVKWAGAKRWLVPFLNEGIRTKLAVTGGRYVEPFLGGGAIALNLAVPGMILGDACKPLIGMYEAVRRKPRDVAWALQALAQKGTDRDSYLRVRATHYPSPVLAAARFLYLNKLSFNGLYRENRKGQFNVPYGDEERGTRKTGVFPTVEEIEAVGAVLAEADLRVADFRATLAAAKSGDVVYCDPPYLNTYSDYTAGGFSEADHVELAEKLHAAVDAGATIVTTNSDNARVRELYSWTYISSIMERRSVGATVARRGDAASLIILSDPALLHLGD